MVPVTFLRRRDLIKWHHRSHFMVPTIPAVARLAVLVFKAPNSISLSDDSKRLTV